MTSLTPPLITALATGVLIILQMLLLFLVVGARRKAGQSLGDGGHPQVLQASRRHGNLAENAALVLLALALFETLGGDRRLVEILAGLFLLARISHAIGLSLKKTVNPLRVVGVLTTVGVGVVLGVRLIMIGWSALNL
jgi:hypothetical protein